MEEAKNNGSSETAGTKDPSGLRVAILRLFASQMNDERERIVRSLERVRGHLVQVLERTSSARQRASAMRLMAKCDRDIAKLKRVDDVG